MLGSDLIGARSGGLLLLAIASVCVVFVVCKRLFVVLMVVRGKYSALEEDDSGNDGGDDSPDIRGRQQNYIR